MTFDRAGHILLTKYQELLAQGYPEPLIEASLRRCVGWAKRLTRNMPAEIREDAFISLLRDNLVGAEDWIKGFSEKVAV